MKATILVISLAFFATISGTVFAVEAVLQPDEFNVDVSNTEIVLAGNTTVADLAPDEVLSCDTTSNRLDIETNNDLAAAMIAKASRLPIKIDYIFRPGAAPGFACDIATLILGNDGAE